MFLVPLDKIFVEHNLSMKAVPYSMSKAQEKYFTRFSSSLAEGIDYYKELFKSAKGEFDRIKDNVLLELNNIIIVLNDLKMATKVKQQLATVKQD